MKHIDADGFLDYVDTESQVLLCFASIQDLLEIQSTLDRIDKSRQTAIVRVEPTVENAIGLQISKHPTFILYRDGSEVWQTVGCENLQTKLEDGEL